ncbi:MAG: succinate dehydrogenase cytochrome b subunit [Limisphaerales bacterium]
MKIWHSSLGKKYIMGVSGFALVFFIFVHLMGNLQIFVGPYWLNTYGQFLHERHEILWPARIGLLTLVVLHIWSAFKLRAENKAARPVGYAGNPALPAASYASRTIMMSGLIIAAFVIFHLLHYALAVRAVNLTGIDFGALRDAEGRPDLYLMMLLGFSKWPISVFYIIAVGLLGLHLSHGMRAMFQSVGWKWTFGGVSKLPDRIARWTALAIFILYASIPTAVMCGYGKAYKEKALQQLTAGATAGKEVAR